MAISVPDLCSVLAHLVIPSKALRWEALEILDRDRQFMSSC